MPRKNGRGLRRETRPKISKNKPPLVLPRVGEGMQSNQKMGGYFPVEDFPSSMHDANAFSMFLGETRSDNSCPL